MTPSAAQHWLLASVVQVTFEFCGDSKAACWCPCQILRTCPLPSPPWPPEAVGTHLPPFFLPSLLWLLPPALFPLAVLVIPKGMMHLAKVSDLISGVDLSSFALVWL